MLGQVREALFNILGDQIVDAQVWDLFAGTGANGIEALSRGARRVVFVEKANRALRILRDNLALLDEEDLDYEVVRGNAWDPLEDEDAPDIVFYDPPYTEVREDPTKSLARAARVVNALSDGGRLVFHFPEGVLDEDDLAELGDVDLRCWGGSAVALVRREPLPH